MCPTTSEEIERMSRISYASTIESLIYVMLCIRPDIIIAVSVMNKFQLNPDEEHYIIVKNILKYLWRTKNLFLIFGEVPELQIEGYIDSDFMLDPDDRKSTSEYVFICNGGAVS